MARKSDLIYSLHRIDGAGYKAYKDITGAYEFDRFTLHIDHVQGDPFAAPSKLRVQVPQSVAKLPEDLFANPIRRMALEDFLTRQVHRAIREIVRGRRGTGKSGLIEIDSGGQEVLERASLVVTSDWVEARLYAGLPAAGRRILADEAAAMFQDELPAVVDRALLWNYLPQHDARTFVDCVENQESIRAVLNARGLVAFVADDSILPRESGASDRPLPRNRAVPFQSPESLRVTFDLPNPIRSREGERSSISGMGIPDGVTLIVGGGYHGKSTLLNAIELGVYPHIPGDGREYVVATRDAVKIRAEDGRSLQSVDISPFISELPYGRDTQAFSTEDASGSTSQAGNIIEALEIGAILLLLDEDTSATNFMVRDARMQALVHKDDEPITPFLDRVRELQDRFGVSTVLVMGGSGDYFDVADTVIRMRAYVPEEATAEAREIARAQPTQRRPEALRPLDSITPRIPLTESFDPSRGRRDVKIDARGIDTIVYGTDTIDLSGVEQLVDTSQARAVGHAIHLATERFMDGRATLREVVEAMEAFFKGNGLDALDPFHRPERHPGSFARPRKYEIAAAINRLRSLRMRQKR